MSKPLPANVVIKTFNRLTQHLCDPKTRTYPVRHTPKTDQSAARLGRWCADKDINLVHFIKARHEAIGWQRRIPMERMTRVSGAFLEKYFDWMAPKLEIVARDRRNIKKTVPDTSRVDSLTTLGEIAKSEYAAAPKICLAMSAEAEPITGCWHPDSKWCQICPESDRCQLLLSPMTRMRRWKAHQNSAHSSSGS